jgi:hypothetical protein
MTDVPPPSVRVGPTMVDVCVLTQDGATVEITLQRPRGLISLPNDEVVARAQRMALSALEAAVASLRH